MSAQAEAVLRILERVTSMRGLADEMDTDLFEAGLLDSLGIVSLVVAFGDELGVTVHPGDLDKQEWSTPRKMVADIERRTGAAA